MSLVHQDVATDIGVLWEYEGGKFEQVVPILLDEIHNKKEHLKTLTPGSAPAHYTEEYIEVLEGMIPIFDLSGEMK